LVAIADIATAVFGVASFPEGLPITLVLIGGDIDATSYYFSSGDSATVMGVENHWIEGARDTFDILHDLGGLF